MSTVDTQPQSAEPNTSAPLNAVPEPKLTQASINDVNEPALASQAPAITSEHIIQCSDADGTGTSVIDEPDTAPNQHVYVAGKIRVHFPNEGLEKENEAAAQEIGVQPYEYGKIFGYKDSNGFKQYRYLAEQASWILTVDDQDAYVLIPHTIVELNEFIATQNEPENYYTVAIGQSGPMAPPNMSDDLPLQTVNCNHLFSFSYEILLEKLRGYGINTTTTAITNVLRQLCGQQNLGNTDFERAKNYLAFRYPYIYATTRQGLAVANTALVNTNIDNPIPSDDICFLVGIDTRYSDSAPGRVLVDVIFTYQQTISGRQFSYYTSVDVTERFPFLHRQLTDYISSAL